MSTAESIPESGVGDFYDVVVVGAGMAGLTAGALLAKNGKSVLVVEGRDRPGGHCRNIEATTASGTYSFDPAVRSITGDEPDSTSGPVLILSVLDLLGVLDRCNFRKADPMYTAVYPGVALEVPTGRKAYLEAHASLFPGDADGLARLADLSAKLNDEILAFPVEPGIRDWLRAPLRWPNVIRHGRATAARIAERHLKDPNVRSLYFTLCIYLGLPPSRLPFSVWASMTVGFVDNGAWYVQGGFGNLADAVAEGLVRHGGDLLLGATVDRIHVDGGRVSAVSLRGGRRVRTASVISTTDARRTFGTLVEPEHLPRRYLKRIRKGEASMAVQALYLGTDLDLNAMGVGQETIVQDTWDVEANFRRAVAGEMVGLSITVPSIFDPSRAPSGHHTVTLLTVAPANPAVTGASAAEMVRRAERIVPGLGNHVTCAYGSEGPADEATTLPLHRIDAAFGWAATTGQTGPLRLHQTTPVDGLFLAGHWTQPLHGVWTVIASGARAARLVLTGDASGAVGSLSGL